MPENQSKDLLILIHYHRDCKYEREVIFDVFYLFNMLTANYEYSHSNTENLPCTN